MKIICFIVFAAINLLLMLRVPEGAAKLKYLKIYSIGIPVTFLLAVLAMLLMKAGSMRPDESVKAIFMAVLMSILMILLMNIIVIASSYLVDFLLKFHTSQNAANADRFPVSFLSQNQTTVKNVFKWLFFSGSLLMLYGLWVAKK